MKKNMGYLDRAIRSLFAVAVAVLYFIGYINDAAGIILGVFSLIFLMTSIIGFCPLYVPLKLNTIQFKDPDDN